MKNELGGKNMIKLLRLRAKTYIYYIKSKRYKKVCH